MSDQRVPKTRRRFPWLLGAVVLGLLVLLILLQSSNVWKTFAVETASDTLLLYALSSLNFIAFVIFGFIFLRSIIKLARERRSLQLGSKIKTRLLLYFAAVSLLPIVAMAGFSYLFMNRALERWFTQMPENVVRQAKEVQGEATADQSQRLAGTARMLAAVIEKRPLSDGDLQTIAAEGNLTRIEMLGPDGSVLRASGKRLDAAAQAELQRILDYARAGLIDEPLLQDGRGFDAAVAPLSGGRKLIIVPDLAQDASVSDIVDKSLQEFDLLKQQQLTVRQIGLSTLGVLTFLLIFASTWTAFYIARGLAVPIKALAEGADEIAKGKLGHQVDVLAEDELALLVDSFNQMSARLAENAEAITRGRRYIETVLQSLPTGVISVDADNRVSTINRAAIGILSLETADFRGLELSKLVSEDNSRIFERLVSRARRVGHAAEQTSLRRETMTGRAPGDGTLPVALIATALPGDGGAVLVIEDLSDLISAQRAAAWQEVARRMAHEIKNPLTPIQLSAERIAKRFAVEPAAVAAPPMLAAPDLQTSKIVREGTDTILREVRSLKAMVDEFSRFARLPDAALEPGDVNDVVRHVLAAYDGRLDDVAFEPVLDSRLPDALIDAEQLKRVFVNLIENAIEAFDDDAAGKVVAVTTRFDAARDVIVAEVADNGRGIEPSAFQKLFQPYFSTKGRGTGLGLAIVHRIISDHKGKIVAVPNEPSGARFVIEIPAAHQS
ncbi:MAG: ATP-binding protein [Pyrinomonadaceae bacterium]